MRHRVTGSATAILQADRIVADSAEITCEVVKAAAKTSDELDVVSATERLLACAAAVRERILWCVERDVRDRKYLDLVIEPGVRRSVAEAVSSQLEAERPRIEAMVAKWIAEHAEAVIAEEVERATRQVVERVGAKIRAAVG